jgi:hypothetical protein
LSWCIPISPNLRRVIHFNTFFLLSGKKLGDSPRTLELFWKDNDEAEEKEE